MADPVALNPEQHTGLRMRDAIDSDRFGQQQVVPLVVHEFAQAGSDAPVVFVKSSASGQFQAVQLVGLAAGENLLLQDGQWRGFYTPGALRMDPLRLVRTAPDSDQLAVAVDPDSPLLDTVEGELLFESDGSPSAFLGERQRALGQYFEHGEVTRAMVARLAELDLLRLQELKIDLPGETVKVGGIYLVDEKKLAELADDVVLELHRNGFLQAVYAHLLSLQQVRRLVRLKTGDGPVAA
jgi:hypothetical protein